MRITRKKCKCFFKTCRIQWDRFYIVFRSRQRLPEENVKESDEHQVVREFCDSTGMPKLSEIRETFQRYFLLLMEF